tara:strand:+ start:175 stop:993 length:819 start_codon:yes stop_codon:yes gene_type:complete
MKKFLILGGCSFTANKGSWSDNIDGDVYEIINLGIPSIGNHLISTRVIDNCQRLLDDGVSNEDIKVIVQWSGLYRHDLIVPKGYGLSRPISEIECPMKISEIQLSSNTLIVDSGRKNLNPWPTFFNMMSDEQIFNMNFENILRTQWYFKSNGIKYFMFNGWDIFTFEERRKDNNVREILGTRDQYGNNLYENKNSILVSDKYFYVKNLWNMIDWSNYWTFNNDKVKYGGMLQWVQNNLNLSDWYVSDTDKHPSKKASSEFFNKIVGDFLWQK